MKTAILPGLLLALVLAACTQVPENQAGNPPMAEDLVCKYNGDLACVMVPIGPQTASYDYHGKIYYFCSPECKTAFIKEPEKYLAKSK